MKVYAVDGEVIVGIEVLLEGVTRDEIEVSESGLTKWLVVRQNGKPIGQYHRRMYTDHFFWMPFDNCPDRFYLPPCYEPRAVVDEYIRTVATIKGGAR